MSNIEKIKAEIERQRSFIEGLFIEGDNSFYDGQDDAYNHLLAFIDSLPEEKPSEDLEEAAEEYAYRGIPDEIKQNVKPIADEIIKQFIAGAEWQKMEAGRGYDSRDLYEAYEQGRFEQKEQMMKAAVEGEIGYWNQRGLSIRLDQSLEKLGYGEDTEVKVIIVKQDDRPRD